MTPSPPSDDDRATAEALCAVIRKALPTAIEGVKWSAPSFALEGRDLVTLNFPPKGGSVRVIFHRGAKAKDTKTGVRLLADPSGRLEWASDQRAHTTFSGSSEVRAAAKWLAATCRAWVERA